MPRAGPRGKSPGGARGRGAAAGGRAHANAAAANAAAANAAAAALAAAFAAPHPAPGGAAGAGAAAPVPAAAGGGGGGGAAGAGAAAPVPAAAGGGGGGGAAAAAAKPPTWHLCDALLKLVLVVVLMLIAKDHYRMMPFVALVLMTLAAFAFGHSVQNTDPQCERQKFSGLFFVVVFGIGAWYVKPESYCKPLDGVKPTLETLKNHFEEVFVCRNIVRQLLGDDSELDYVKTADGGRQKKYAECWDKYNLKWGHCDEKELTKAIATEFSCKKL